MCVHPGCGSGLVLTRGLQHKIHADGTSEMRHYSQVLLHDAKRKADVAQRTCRKSGGITLTRGLTNAMPLGSLWSK